MDELPDEEQRIAEEDRRKAKEASAKLAELLRLDVGPGGYFDSLYDMDRLELLYLCNKALMALKVPESNRY